MATNEETDHDQPVVDLIVYGSTLVFGLLVVGMFGHHLFGRPMGPDDLVILTLGLTATIGAYGQFTALLRGVDEPVVYFEVIRLAAIGAVVALVLAVTTPPLFA